MKDTRLVLAEQAYQAIERECLAHQATETGGVLVGRRLGGEIIVPFVIPAGPAAMQCTTRFRPDAAWQQTLLDYLFERFGLDYVGDYHRHPGGFDRPSVQDRETARHIVTDREWDKVEALFPIAVLDGNRMRLRSYLMTRVDTEFMEIGMTVVPDCDRRIRKLLLTNPGQLSKGKPS